LNARDSALVEELVAALAEYRPDPNRLVVPDGPPPEQATTPAPSRPRRAHRSIQSRAWTRSPHGLLLRDGGSKSGSRSPPNTRLLRHGWRSADWCRATTRPRCAACWWAPGHQTETASRFTTEELRGLRIATHAVIDPPTRIREVLLHGWSSGVVWKLWHQVTQLYQPLYQGGVAPHRPLVPPATPPTDSGDGVADQPAAES